MYLLQSQFSTFSIITVQCAVLCSTLQACMVTSDGVYSDGEVAALLRPGEKGPGPLTLLPLGPEPEADGGPALVTTGAESPGVAPGVTEAEVETEAPSLRYSATCRLWDSNTWYLVGFSSLVSI